MRGARKASAIGGVSCLVLVPMLLVAQGAQRTPAERAPAVEMAGFRVSPPDGKWDIETNKDRTIVTFSRSKGKGLLGALSPLPQRREASVIVSTDLMRPWDWTMTEAAAADYVIKGYAEEIVSLWSSAKLLEKGEMERGDKRLRFAKYEVASTSQDGVPLITDLFVHFYLPADFRKSHRYFEFESMFMRPSGGVKLYHNPGADPVLAVVDSLEIDDPLKDIPGPDGELIRAAAAGNMEAARAALDRGAKPDASSGAATALSEAALQGRKDIVELLLDRGADIDHADDQNGQTPLVSAVAGLEPDIARMLIERGANVNKAAREGDSPLAVAAITKQASTASLLIERGAEIETKNAEGDTPLMYAGKSGASDIVKLLMERGAKIDAQAADGGTALMLAVFHRRADTAQLLLSAGADINLKRADGVTALWLALGNNVTGIIGALVQRGADLTGSVTGKSGEVHRNILHLAILQEAPWIAKLAIEAGVDVNAKDATGRTPLMKAAALGQVEIVKLLLEKGADINAKDETKKNAAWWAKVTGQKEILKILKAAGAK
jgi:ankyrin repeat protein